MSSTFVGFGCNVVQVINFSAFHFLKDRSSNSKSSELLNYKKRTQLCSFKLHGFNCAEKILIQPTRRLEKQTILIKNTNAGF